jgi:hypothetical protein
MKSFRTFLEVSKDEDTIRINRWALKPDKIEMVLMHQWRTMEMHQSLYMYMNALVFQKTEADPAKHENEVQILSTIKVYSSIDNDNIT